ncbi:alpha/beta fold hydrolase [Xenorhabdus bovienii]|uniref:alpha/beta hydrolase n=1 Tax=Xenorhabdus bovienii TaxID=40576 RepID=UPI001EDDD0B7|nr:alpha/beta fold hydrolase [Xenorhabdus bovienii]MCG3462481.1 alpha/beta fold hydrolase [Xenorhabdus bovienii]
MQTEDLIFSAAGQTLAGTRVLPSAKASSTVLTLHGLGATATRHSIRYVLDPLALNGHGSLCFEFSGNGDSSGVLNEATLGQRRYEALSAARLLTESIPPVLIGTSMGGHLAASLVPELQPRALILFCPAAYPQFATELPFDENFTRPGRYDDSPAYQRITAFTGNLLIVAARNDQIVPAEVVEGYLDHAQLARNKEIIWLEGCDHFIHRWLPYQNELNTQIQQAILSAVTCSAPPN